MSRIAKSLLLIVFLISFTGAGTADSFEQSYKNIRPAQPTQTEDKIEVVEVFWYGCPHCYDFEPYLDQWLATKPDDVEFRRMPGIFNKSWIPHAKTYFTAIKMGVLEKIHHPLFAALHKKKERLYTEQALQEFVTRRGVDSSEFTKIYHSNEIETKIKQAFVMGQRYGVTGVPAVVINGKYLTNGTMARSYDNLLKVIDKLVDRERQGLKEHRSAASAID